MRKPPGPPPPIDPSNDQKITLIRHYEVVTPLFGGGVNPNETVTDPPVRVPSIRGQLRFWWRATKGAYTNISELHKAESAVWGTTAKPKKAGTSKVSIYIKSYDNGSAVHDPQELDADRQYGTFPLMEEAHDIPLRTGVKFSLSISFKKEVAEDVQAALWAWETFGGVGARTRRGFGALHCTGCDVQGDDGEWMWPYKSDGARKNLTKYIKDFVCESGWHEHVPHISRDAPIMEVMGKGQAGEPGWIWGKLLSKLKDFRQRRPNYPYGRNRWPEPDTIRRFTGQSRYKDEPREFIFDDVDKFPRAAFGLPIVFHFQRSSRGQPPDPYDVQLEGRKKNRLASPLILRPLVCDDGRAVGLAMVLAGPRVQDMPGGLELKNLHRKPPKPISAELTQPEADKIAAEHSMYDGNTDVLQAFLENLRS